MLDRLSRFLIRQSGKPRSVLFRIAALAAGSFVFLVLAPLLLGLVSQLVPLSIRTFIPRSIEIAIGVPLICIGLALLCWAVAAFWRFGGGTPAPVAAPQKLVVRGPYRYCRNPIQLGAICYFFGLGCLLLSFIEGLAMFLIGLILGSVYHKLVEEPELLLRFGADYAEYRKRTPFLIHRPWRKYDKAL